MPLRPEIKNYNQMLILVCLNRLVHNEDWVHILSSQITKKDIDVLGKLYISVDNKDLYGFANMLLDCCVTEKLEDVEFKVNNNENVTRRDNVVIYFTKNNFSKYISIITRIIKENPNLQFNSQNPLGYSVDNNICIGSDFEGGTKSFNDACCKKIVELREKGWEDGDIVDSLDIAIKNHLSNIIELINYRDKDVAER